MNALIMIQTYCLAQQTSEESTWEWSEDHCGWFIWDYDAKLKGFLSMTDDGFEYEADEATEPTPITKLSQLRALIG